MQPRLDPEKLVFIDETGAHTKMARRQALPDIGAPRPLEDHHVGVRASPGWSDGTHGHG